MHELMTFALAVFMAFFAMLNPIADTPMFLSITEGQTDEERQQTAKTATLVAFAVLLVFTILGKYIFEMFDITIPAFKITGGILIFYIGFEMLMSKKSSTKTTNTQITQNDNVAISPLAVPMTAGPGMIVTSMNYVTHVDFIHVGIVVVMLAIIIYLNYLCFSLSKEIIRVLGKGLISVIGKLMGLILAIIGTGMTIEGLQISFPILGS